ncbi:hypothetical protein [Paenibacillus taichungensis]|uniref:hypothetical protein n=1 Tax=Paenibacillus taichungensis TaxID=484184 RepID=UPI003D9A36D5
MKTESRLKHWTHSEDKIFIDTIYDLVMNKSYTLNKALDYVAEKLQRSKSGCAFRYNKIIRQQLDPQVLEKISSNNPANMSTRGKIIDSNAEQINIDLIEQKVDDFSRVNSLKNELRDIESRVLELEKRKTQIVSELKIYLNDIMSLIKSTS